MADPRRTAAARAILFDFNGVLVDDEALHFETLRDTLSDLGLPLTRAGYDAEYLGFDDRECFRHAFVQHGWRADDAAVGAAIEAKAARYAERIVDELRLVPGAEAFVRAAGREHRLAVVSGAIRREIEQVLGMTGLLDCFSTIVAAEDVAACKPDPAGFRLGLEQLGVPAGRAVVVEDSLPGLQAARALGLRCAMLTTSHPARDLAAADTIWPSFEGRLPNDLPWPGD